MRNSQIQVKKNRIQGKNNQILERNKNQIQKQPDTPSTDEEKTVENTSEKSEKANDVDTAVAMPLAGAFGTMSVSLAGIGCIASSQTEVNLISHY